MSAKKFYIHLAVAVVLFILLRFLPATNGLTEIGVNVLSVFIPILYIWLTLGTDWSSWLAMALIFFTGVLTPAEVYSGVFGSSLIITVIGMMAFSKVLSDTGVIEYIVKHAVTMEIVRNRPYVFIAMVLAVCGLVSFAVDVGAVSLVFISIIVGICDEIGYKKGDPFYTALIIGLFWVTNAFNAGSPLGHALPVVMLNAAAAGGYNITYAQWLSVGLPAAILISVASILVICLIWRPEASKFSNYDLDAHRANLPKLSRQGLISLIMLLLVIVYWIVPVVFPNLLGDQLMALYNSWGSSMPLIIAIALLCVIHVDGKPISTFREMTSTTTVSTLLFIGVVVTLGTAISSESAGISVWLGNLLAPVTSSMSVFAIVVIGCLGCVILTNFISNTVSMLLFYSVMVPIVEAGGGPVIGVIVMLCMMACFASLVPSAAVTAPFFFGPGHITVKNTAKWNVVMIFIAWAITVFLIYPLCNMLF
ncbi:MAG: anion permease [Lachnospiraceae bacterium]|nr:anion permease [Lachnospiraceae bacterium]